MSTNEEVKDAIVVDRDKVVTVQLHEQDLEVLVQLLSVTNDFYKKIADAAIKAEDALYKSQLDARSKLCDAFTQKFNTYLIFPESLCKEVH